MQLSEFAQQFSERSGIIQLMDDLGTAMASGSETLMLGGGNPAHIPEVQAFFRARMQSLLDAPDEFARIIGNYGSPQGDRAFLTAVAELLNREYGWGLSADNVTVTNGSQSAFFLLFNMLAGKFAGGPARRILLPMTPEYIGYDDVGLAENIFAARRPAVERFDDRTFKYHVDFDSLDIDETIGAVCVSRPTNPTGNVLTDAEVERLSELAAAADIPLIIDAAYGAPFPNILFTAARPAWDKHVVLCLSLSKLGLPGTRTGIIIARPELIKAVAGINAIINLAPENFGPALALDLVQSGEVIRISNELIRPYYESKAQRALALLRRELDGVEYYAHKAEGAIFLWLWFPGLPISCQELYRRLKRRGVLIIPGHYFFPGLAEDDWPHKQECIRMTYSMGDEVVREGVRVIAEEVKRL